MNTTGAHIFTNSLRQLLHSASHLQHLRLQAVDTLNDEVSHRVRR